MKGYFLPGVSLREEESKIGEINLRLAILRPSQIIDISNRLAVSHEKLARESIFTIVDWIDQAAVRWIDSDSATRKEAESLLPMACGLSKEMVRLVLDDLFKHLRRPLLFQLIQEELGDPVRLDQFRPKEQGPGFSRAFGPDLITHILPGNIPGTAVMSLVLGLLAKSANLARVSHREIMLPLLFARSLYEIWPEMAQNIGVVTWHPDQNQLTEAALRQADLTIVYGSDATIAAIRKMTPPTTRLLCYSRKVSLGIIARESLQKQTADEAALDVALYDQRGCLSPHLYYVEAGGPVSPLEFSKWLAQSLDALSNRLPRGETSSLESARIQQLRGAISLKGGAAFSSQEGVGWTVLYDPDPDFSLSPLSRTIWVKPVDDLSEIPSRIQPIRQSLQAIGIAFPEERQATLVSAISQVGGCRLCPIGQMQRPPITWHHDGQPRLLPLLRFVDWEKP